MKKLISLTMLFVATSGASVAQLDKNMFAYQSSSTDLFSLFSNKKYFLEMRINDVSIKAMRDFVKSFKDVQEEKWYKVSGGFVSSFMQKGVQTKSCI